MNGENHLDVDRREGALAEIIVFIDLPSLSLHPRTEGWLAFEAPVPRDMAATLRALKNARATDQP